MIKGHCRTNLDDGRRHDWPKVFVDVPRVGDYVEATVPRGGNVYCSCLKVCRVTHYVAKEHREYGSLVDDDGRRFDYEPRIEVELNK